MADKLADLSPEERAQRVAEMKAKMQSSAKKAKAETPEAGATPAAAVSAAPAPEAKAEAAPAATAPGVAVAAPAQPEVKPATNGHGSNGTAGTAEIVSAAPAVYTAPFVEDTPEQKAHKEMNRREFLTYAWGAALGLLILEGGLVTFFFMYPRFRAGEFGGKFFVGPESSMPPSDAPPVPFTDGKFWLVTTEQQEPRALYMVCTHLGCLYKWAPSNFRFECPCHGSKFSHDGYYIEGPAPRSLDTFELTIEEGEVVVNTGKRIVGAPAADSPARATPA